MKRVPQLRLVCLAVFLFVTGCATAPPAPSGDSPRPAAPDPGSDEAPPTRGTAGDASLGEADLRVAAALLRMEDRREYDPAVVIAASTSSNPQVRRRAALAAGRVGDPRALPVLGGFLADPDTSVAATAAFALGLLGDSAAVPVLTRQLSGADAARRPTVAGEAASALGRLGTQTARRAVEGLLRSVPADAPHVREAIGPALLAVWKFRPADAAPILPWLRSADPEVRWRAAYALTRRPDPAGTAALHPLAGDADARVRQLVMRSLTAALADSTALGADAARRTLLAAVEDADLGVRVNAVRSLGTHRHPDATRVLEGLVMSGEPHLAETAAQSLGRMGLAAQGAAATLQLAAMDARRPVSVRTASLLALAGVAPEMARAVAVELGTEPEWRLRAAAGSALAGLPAPRPARLDELLRDADPRVAAAVLGALVEQSGDSVAPLRNVLVESLGHPDVMVRTAALGGLGKLADPASLAVLLDAYGRAQADTLNDAALAAVDALGALESEAAARSFFARYGRSPDALVRLRVETAFGDSAALHGWGPALPVETGRSGAEYLAAVRGSAGERPMVRIVTDRGAFDVELFADDAPLTVASFLSLARSGYFNGQAWPRVVPNFVIQGGDPRGDTSGGPGYVIRDEVNRHPYLRGTVGMALSGPDTGGSQFFVTHSPQPHLDGTYTVFGRVARGMDVVDAILQGDRIIRVEEVR